jgi:hypothetical protein
MIKRLIILLLTAVIIVNAVILPSVIIATAIPIISEMTIWYFFLRIVIDMLIALGFPRMDIDFVIGNIDLSDFRSNSINWKGDAHINATAKQLEIFAIIVEMWAEISKNESLLRILTPNAISDDVMVMSTVAAMNYNQLIIEEMSMTRAFMRLLFPDEFIANPDKEIVWNTPTGSPVVTRTVYGYSINTGIETAISFDGASFRVIGGSGIFDVTIREISKIDNTRLYPFFEYGGETYIFSRQDSATSRLGISFSFNYRKVDGNDWEYLEFNSYGLISGVFNTGGVYPRGTRESFNFPVNYNLRLSGNTIIYFPESPPRHDLGSNILVLPETVLRVSDGQLMHWVDAISTGNSVVIEDAAGKLMGRINIMIGTVADVAEVLAKPGQAVNKEDEKLITIPMPYWQGIIKSAIDKGLVRENPELVIDNTGVRTVDGIDIKELERLINITVDVPATDLKGVIELLQQIYGRQLTAQELTKIHEMLQTQTTTLVEILEAVRTLTEPVDVPIVWTPEMFGNFSGIDRFPFSLPWDLMRILTMFIVEEKDPVFEFELKTNADIGGVEIGVDEVFVLDLTALRIGGVDVVKVFINFVSLVLFVAALIKLTPKLLK